MIRSSLTDLELALQLTEAVQEERVLRREKSNAYAQVKNGARGYVIGQATVKHSTVERKVDRLMCLLWERRP